jgi:hypothetical protein
VATISDQRPRHSDGTIAKKRTNNEPNLSGKPFLNHMIEDQWLQLIFSL